MNKTALPLEEKTKYRWFLFDAEAITLGRLSTEISKVLIGKNLPEYEPSKDMHHGVIVINAEKVIVTGKKSNDKFYYKHSGRPGGLTIETFRELQTRLPSRIIERAVKGMLPKGALGRNLFTKLKVYKGPSHPHQAQKPKTVEKR